MGSDDASVGSEFTSATGSGTFTGSHDGLQPKAAYVDPVVAEKEQRAVFWSKILVISVLVIAVTMVATTVYLLSSKSETHNFETQVSWIQLECDDKLLFLRFEEKFSCIVLIALSSLDSCSR